MLDKGILIRRDDLMNVMFHCENGELSAPLRSDRVEKECDNKNAFQIDLEEISLAG